MAIGPLRLADKSAWEQTRYDSRARERVRGLRDAGQLATCVVSTAELLYSARNAAELRRIRGELSALPYLITGPETERQVADITAALAERGQHRTPVPDIMIAAIAASSSAVVLHYDADYERIAVVTGQAHEWILPRGTGHGGTGNG